MGEFGGYEYIEELHRGSRSIVYRARRRSDGESVILKRASENSPRLFAVLRHEYAILKDFQHPNVVRGLNLEVAGGGLALIREDVDGEPLSRLIQDSGGPALLEVLQTALDLAEALSALHSAGIIHKDVKPANILRCADGRTRLTDFSHASLLERETASPERIQGTLAYISPEQTGRMNRSVDRRTDLYSLGATLYELIAGRPPFLSEDPLELVHSHIARRPPPLSSAPTTVREIIRKLLEKNPEDRYHSAAALAADLRRCLASLKATGAVEDFTPGAGYASAEFQIPEKLYGRETEARRIRAVFAEIVGGERRLLLVSGPSGAGKTALVNEVQRPLARERGLFVAGKSDQFRRNEPYAALLGAAQQLVRGLFALEEDRLRIRRQELKDALGDDASVLVEVLPDLERILGPQPPATSLKPLKPSEARHRFQNALSRFLREFTREPLVLFLDDLQWADAASLDLLEKLVGEDGPPRLLIVGAYRDNEVDAAHPLRISLRRIAGENPFVELQLRPLRAQDIDRMLVDTLSPGDVDDADRRVALRKIVTEKTAGNPFFVNQFLRSLHQDGWITHAREGWRWDEGQLRQAGFTDNVIDLMVGRLKRLPRDAREMLRVAAALGNTFALSDLARIEAREAAEIFESLWPALKAGMLLPLDENYKQLQRPEQPGSLQNVSEDSIARGAASANLSRGGAPSGGSVAPVRLRFLHDRVQQAAYATVPENELPSLHLKIGRSLIGDAQADALPGEQIFEIVGHLNAGLPLATPVEGRRIAELNLHAARRARRSAAHSVTGACARAGLAALDLFAELESESDAQSQTTRPNLSDRHYETAFALMLLNGEALYLVGEYEAAEAEFARALDFARGEYDRARVHTLQTVLLTLRGEFQSAIEAGRVGLALLGEDLKLDKVDSAAFRKMLQVRKRSGDRSFEELLALPEMSDRHALALLELYVEMTAAAYFLDTALAGLLAMNITLLSLEHGVAPGSAWGFINVGTFLVMLNQMDEALGWGRLALDLNERQNDTESRCRLLCMYGFYLSHWKHPARNTRDILDEAFRYGEQTGDSVYAGYALVQNGLIRFQAGAELEELARDLEQQAAYFERRQFVDGRLAVDSLRRLLGELREETGTPEPYQDYLRRLDRSEMMMIRHVHLVHEMQRLYLAGDFPGVLATAERSAELAYLSAAQMHLVEENFFASLAAIEVLRNQADAALAERVAKNQKQLAIWAQNCPANFRARHLIVQAGQADLAGETLKAIDLYEAAIAAAGEAGIQNVQALAAENAARFAARTGRFVFARACAAEAHRSWLRWGANKRARLWRESMAEYFSPTGGTSSDSSSESLDLDLNSIIKAARAISGEIVLANLIERLLQILLQSVGAVRGCVILEGDREWRIVARGGIEGSERLDLSLKDADFVPRSMILHAMRARESLVVNDARRAEQFQQDEYIRRLGAASLLVAPLEHQAKLVGAVYLENDLMQNAFGPERERIAEVLCAQAAISIDNAVLYDRLEARVKERTAELEAARETAERSRQDILNLNEFSKRVNSATALGDVLDQVFAYIQKHYAIEGILAGTVSPDRNTLEFHNGLFPDDFDPKAVERLRRMPVNLNSRASSAARSIARKRPVYFPRLKRLKKLPLEVEQIYVDQGVQSILMVPLIVRGEAIGLLIFFTMRRDVNLRSILPNIDNFCEQIAGAVNSANLLAMVAAEREKSDRLLLNILPEQAARELKERGEVEPQHYESATVLFSDFQGFTAIASRMQPEELVRELNQIFHQFDSICERHNVEKLKTIGDAFMCAGGLPEQNETHTIDVCLAALEMIDFLNGIAAIKRDLHGEEFWRMRVGLHTGPVMAGVVGKRKFAYDIWGDAVNVASRCESNGAADRINISEDAYRRIKDFFVCEYRGPIEVKNRGKIAMYFLNGILPELSLSGEGRVPNKEFRERYEAVRTRL
ncbi:MAG: AAA family ATPase [bacterium]|nr:AAA family ATPase [bacterium]